MLGDSDCINGTSQEERDTNIHVNQTQHYSGQHGNTQWALRNWLSRLGRECNARNATEIGTWHAHCKQHGRAQNVNVKRTYMPNNRQHLKLLQPTPQQLHWLQWPIATGNKAQALISLATRTTRECIQCIASVCIQLVAEVCIAGRQHTKQVATTSTLRTVQHTSEDNNWMTTWQLHVNWMRTYCIAASAANRRVQNNMHKITCAHQHQIINPTCPITSVPTRGSQQELQHVLPANPVTLMHLVRCHAPLFEPS